MYSLYSIIYRLSFTTRIWTFLLKFQLGQSVEMPFSHQNPDKNRTRTGSGQCCPLNSVLHLVQKLKNSAVPSWSPFWAEKLSIVFFIRFWEYSRATRFELTILVSEVTAQSAGALKARSYIDLLRLIACINNTNCPCIGTVPTIQHM